MRQVLYSYCLVSVKYLSWNRLKVGSGKDVPLARSARRDGGAAVAALQARAGPGRRSPHDPAVA
jgi:hypothetical protein